MESGELSCFKTIIILNAKVLNIRELATLQHLKQLHGDQANVIYLDSWSTVVYLQNVIFQETVCVSAV